MLDIINGKAADSVPPHGVQIPNSITKILRATDNPAFLEGEGITDQIMAAMDYDDEDIEIALNLNESMAEAEALEPSSLAEARRCPDWLQWEQGICEELTTLQKAGTWELIDLPEGANLVGSKWIFRAKKDAAGNIVCYKACLAQGFSQVPGIDYFDTYTPIPKLASIHTVLALAARYNMELHQVNIKGAYLNGELTDKEHIYMHQPPGYANTANPHLVCLLHKTWYGLKQSDR